MAKPAVHMYLNIGFWLLPLVVLVGAGFYPTYFAVILEPRPYIFHLHAFLMMIWLIIVVTQPILVQHRRFRLHHAVGKASYLVVPLLLVSTWLLIRHVYQLQLNRFSVHDARKNLGLPVIYFGWFLVFYPLGVYHRRKVIVHAKYMIATALLVIGPALDRLLFWLVGREDGYWQYLYFMVSFLVIDLVFLLLLNHDRRHGGRYFHTLVVLTLFLAGQLAYLFFRDGPAWQKVVGWLVYPY